MKLTDIKDNTLIICENDYKKYILKYFNDNNLFLNVNFLTKKEFLNNYLFSYDEKTIYYLYKKYNLKIDIIKMYLNNLYFIDENKDYQNNKIIKLKDIKKELIDNKLLYFNPLFKENIKNKNIIVVGYPYLDNYELDIFNSLNSKIIDIDSNYKHNEVFKFNTIYDEVNYITNEICSLIKNGVNINNIKLINVSSEYENVIERVFNLYNIPVKIKCNKTFNGLKITNDFIKYYESNLNETIKKIEKYDSKYLNKIINIINKYSFVNDYLDVKDLIINEIKNTKIDDFSLKNFIEVLDVNSVFDDNTYVFCMNFNSASIPSFIKDEDYITDNIKNEINKKTVLEINKELKEYYIKKLNSIKNLYISYSSRSNVLEYYPSILVGEMNLKITEKTLNDKHYSYLNDKINYACMLDNYYKYGDIDNNLDLYHNTFKDALYKTYNNKYKQIDINELYKVINNKLRLSYSSLDNYNKCAFKYYIKNVLKLDTYDETFDTFIGSLFHDVLEKCFNHDLDVDKEINNYIKEKQLKPSEKFFIKKITEDIKNVINIINKQNEDILFKDALYEKNITIKKDNVLPVEFTGFIDKILYKKEKDKTYISLVDYKTGNIDIDLKNTYYGLSMQLPIYLYLIKKSNLFEKPIFAGFYLQHILNGSKNEEELIDSLKLIGYSNSDVDVLEKFDLNYANSNVLKGVKLKNDGSFYAYSKVLNNDQIDNLIDLTEKNIDSSIDRILKGNFDINPKKIGFDNDLGCKYCKFKDICFKTNNDYVIYEEKEDISFLGGDNNA